MKTLWQIHVQFPGRDGEDLLGEPMEHSEAARRLDVLIRGTAGVTGRLSQFNAGDRKKGGGHGKMGKPAQS